MTQLNSIKITLPNPAHELPHQRGVFEQFPKVKELEKIFASLERASEHEAVHHRGELSAYLKRMSKEYHPSLPDLLDECQVHIGLLADVHLEKVIHICEIAFHGHRKVEHKPDLAVMLRVAIQALLFIGALLRHKLAHHEVPFAEMHDRFFHFAHAAMACRQQLGDRTPKGLHEKVTATVSLYLLLERLDLFSMNDATQKGLTRALASVASECDVYFIPAGMQLDSTKGFWVDMEDKHSTERSQMHGVLAGVSEKDRIATNIFPLVRQLEQQLEKKGSVSGQAGMSEEVKKLIRRKITAPKRRAKRTESHEGVRLLTQWMDVVDLRPDRGSNALLLDYDDIGFRLLVEDRNAALPDVDSFIAVNRPGHGVIRGVLIWKRIEANGVVLGGVWVREKFHQAQMSLLGHSEMSVGLREWHAMIRRLDDRRMVCWIGERSLQPGISILFPLGKKKFSSTLEQVDHRGGNYCRGILVVGEEWKESHFELDG